MRFDSIENPINYNYSISNLNIELLANFRDLGVIFDSKLKLSTHTEIIKNKAIRNLNFIQ